jgi:hypothetical protein
MPKASKEAKMYKAVILFSFKNEEKDRMIVKNLPSLGFNRKDGRRIVFSKEIPMDVAGLFTLAEVKKMKDIIEESTDKVMIEGPRRVWRRALISVGVPGWEQIPVLNEKTLEPVINPLTKKPITDEQNIADQIARTLIIESGTVKPYSLTDTGDSRMSEEAPIIPKKLNDISQKEQKSIAQQVQTGITVVHKDQDVDELAALLANTGFGGRRNTRRGKKLRRRYSRKV